MSNATDGEIYIAWALAMAADRWGGDYRPAAERIARNILRLCVTTRDGRRRRLLGAAGFIHAEGVVVNLSYDAFPALRALSRVVPDAAFIGTPAFAGPVLAAQPGFDVVITGLTGGSLGTLQDLWQPLPSDILAGFRARLSPRDQAVEDQAGNLGALL